MNGLNPKTLADRMKQRFDDILNSGDERLKLKYHLYDHMTIDGALKRNAAGVFFLINDGHVVGFEEDNNDILDQQQMGRQAV